MTRLTLALAALLTLSAPATSWSLTVFMTRSSYPYDGLHREQIANVGGVPAHVFQAGASGNYDLWYDVSDAPIINLQLNFNVVNGAVVTAVLPNPSFTGGSASNAAAIWNNLGGGLNFIASGAPDFNCSFFGASAGLPGGNCPGGAPFLSNGSEAGVDGTRIFLAGTFALDLSGHTGGDVIRIAESSVYNLATGGPGISFTEANTLARSLTVLAAPEPATLALLLLSCTGAAIARRREDPSSKDRDSCASEVPRA